MPCCEGTSLAAKGLKLCIKHFWLVTTWELCFLLQSSLLMPSSKSILQFYSVSPKNASLTIISCFTTCKISGLSKTYPTLSPLYPLKIAALSYLDMNLNFDVNEWHYSRFTSRPLPVYNIYPVLICYCHWVRYFSLWKICFVIFPGGPWHFWNVTRSKANDNAMNYINLLLRKDATYVSIKDTVIL